MVTKTDYITKKDDDMSVHGWVKELTFKYFTLKETGEIICEEYDFYVRDIQHDCGSVDYLWLVPEKNGPFLACTYCKTVETLSRDNGIKRKRYKVTVQKAIDIMLARGYKLSDPPMRPYTKLARKLSPKQTEVRHRPKSKK